MPPIRQIELLSSASLYAYAGAGAYTDCYVADVPRPVSHAEFVQAFYTTWLFKLERLILSWLVRRPSTDDEARDLAHGHREAFAAWRVETRADNQLLLCDFKGRTRSWLMSQPLEAGAGTRLYFGSAVVPVVDERTGEARLGFVFRALLGFHKLYSRALLRTTVSRLSRHRHEQ